MKAADNLQQWLIGSWSLYKEISDFFINREGAFTGKALFKPTSPFRIQYWEEGELSYGNYRGFATQEYMYTFHSPHTASIYRTKQDFFYDLDLREGSCKVEHLCGADLYKGYIMVESDNIWKIFWDIKGPRKKLKMKYIYKRKNKYDKMKPA
jgi:hypothetical protein